MKISTGSEPIFVDAWAWLVMANEKDPKHKDVNRILKTSTDHGGRCVTSDYVLDEAITRLFTQMPFDRARLFFSRIFEAEARRWLTIEEIDSERFRAAWQLRLRYADKPRISFTDLTSFVIMRESGIRYVLTGDAHFSHAGLGFEVLP